MPVIKSYAKVNVALRVYPLRKNERLHRIDSVFVLYQELYDTVSIEPSSVDQVSFENVSIEGEDTVSKAIRLFKQRIPIKEHYAVFVTKRIPLGSGLGGGSSNAAAVLMYLSLRHKVSARIIAKIAFDVGSDVPFFISGLQQARVRGFGVSVVKVHTDWQVDKLIFNPIPSFSKDVYETFDALERPKNKLVTVNRFLLNLCPPFNDLEEAFLKLAPEQRRKLQELRLGNGVPLVSGSGSTVALLNFSS